MKIIKTFQYKPITFIGEVTQKENEKYWGIIYVKRSEKSNRLILWEHSCFSKQEIISDIQANIQWLSTKLLEHGFQWITDRAYETMWSIKRFSEMEGKK